MQTGQALLRFVSSGDARDHDSRPIAGAACRGPRGTTTRALSIVPPQDMQRLGQARIVITNFHAFQPRKRCKPASWRSRCWARRTKERLPRVRVKWCGGCAAIWGRAKKMVLDDEAPLLFAAYGGPLSPASPLCGGETGNRNGRPRCRPYPAAEGRGEVVWGRSDGSESARGRGADLDFGDRGDQGEDRREGDLSTCRRRRSSCGDRDIRKERSFRGWCPISR